MLFAAYILVMFFASTAYATSQCKLNPHAFHFSVGNITGVVAADGPVLVPGNFFSVPDEAVTRSYERVFRDTDPIVWSQNIPVLDTPDGRILVDTGSFNSGLPPFANGGQLIPNLRSAGISPASIDAILLTHGHPDHVSGLITEDGKRAFPNADVYVPRSEHNFWTTEPFVNPGAAVPNETLALFSSIYRRSVGPYERLGKLKQVKNREEPLSGIQFILFPGHTPGHSAIEFSTDGERIVFVGDAWFSQPDQVRNPEWTRPVETNALDGFKSRVRLMKKLAKRKDLVLAFHEDFPGLGRIIQTAGSFDWVPARPQSLGTVTKKC